MESQDTKFKKLDEVRIAAAKARKAAEAHLLSRDEAIRFRASSGVEARWREDQENYDGLGLARIADVVDYASKRATVTRKGRKDVRSTVEVNIIRGRVETAVGRFCEAVIPTTDNNWGLKITPNPDLRELEDDDRPAAHPSGPILKGDRIATIGEATRELRKEAKKRMAGMETVISDQLTECDFNSECRRAVYYSAKLGTGVLKGPSVIKKVDKRWIKQKNGKYKLEARETMVPYSVAVDPFYVFPTADAGSNPRNATGVWEYDTISPRNLAMLIGVEGYDSQAIKSILKEPPLRTESKYDPKAQQVSVNQKKVEHGNRYERWEYNGDIDRQSLEDLGCDLSVTDIELAMMSACIVYVNDIPIKTVLNTLDSGEHPYDFFSWTEVTNSPWGIGIPRQLYFLQKIMTASWRAMMDNAGDSAGVNIIIGKNLVPEDGEYRFGRRKVWLYKGGNVGEDDVRKAFAQFQVDANQGTYQAIIDMVLKFTDLETGIPAIFQGEAQKLPETLGATNIIVDSSNIGLRQRARIFDSVIDSHITRYYHYNMQYHPDDKIKGDYQVDALGVRVLLERDQQTQDLVQLLQLKGDPDVKRSVDWDKVIRKFDKNRKLDVLKSEADIKQAKEQEEKAPQVADPRIEAAKIRADTELKVKSFELKDREAERQHQERIEQIRKDIAITKLSAESGISIEKIKADLAKESAKLNLQRELSQEGPAPEVAEPAAEPPGRAREGHAFEE